MDISNDRFVGVSVTRKRSPFSRTPCIENKSKSLLHAMNVLSTSFVRYKCLKDVFCTLWMSKRHLLNVMNVSKTSFVRYECIKDIFCTLLLYEIIFFSHSVYVM